MRKLFLLLSLFLVISCGAATTAIVPVGKEVTMYLKSCDGTRPFTYQWRKNGVEIPGATADTYILSAANLSDTGTYDLRITNSAGFCISDAYTLTVTTAPIPANNAKVTIQVI